MNTDEILELFKFYSAKEMKSLQTKFSTMGKGIRRDAVEGEIGVFFTPKQKETLKEAAAILLEMKRSIEHAKEIKARHEKVKERLIKVATIKAREYLTEATSSLTLPQKITLSFFSKNYGWPYGQVSVVLETAREEGRIHLEAGFGDAIRCWIDDQSEYMAFFSLPKIYHNHEPIEVTREAATERLNKELSKIDNYTALADEVTSIRRGKQVLSSPKEQDHD